MDQAALDPPYWIPCWDPLGDIGEAPRNNDLRKDLALVRDTDGGIVMSHDTARHILWRLHCLERWPSIAQAKLEELEGSMSYKLAQAQELNRKLQREVASPQNPWKLILGVGIVSGAIGLATGGIVVYLGAR